MPARCASRFRSSSQSGTKLSQLLGGLIPQPLGEIPKGIRGMRSPVVQRFQTEGLEGLVPGPLVLAQSGQPALTPGAVKDRMLQEHARGVDAVIDGGARQD